MANTLKIKRGAKASLPTLAQGEMAFTTDTHETYVGDGSANHRIGPSDENFTTALKNKLESIETGLRWMEAVLDKDLTSPPGSPSTGDRYWIGGTGSGDWAGHDYDVTEYNGSGWDFADTQEGDCAYVDDENIYYFFDGSALKKLSSASGSHASTHKGDGSDPIPAATTSVSGLMASGDKSKLDGIESGATADQTASEIVSLINASAEIIDDNNLPGTICRDSEMTSHSNAATGVHGAGANDLLNTGSTIDGGTF